MLGLRWETPETWVARIERDLDAVLVDHAHCEKKAAGTAINLIFSYVEEPGIALALAPVAREELEHFEQVAGILAARGIRLRGQPPSAYGRELGKLIRTFEPARSVDRFLVPALIEARSCERMTLLRDHLQDRELAFFYGALLESEGRHHGLYVRLAGHFAPEAEVRARLDELLDAEAAIIAGAEPQPRLHA